MDSKSVRLAGIAYESLVNGPGIRRVLFAQGCKHGCSECFNPDTHDLNGGKLVDMDDILKEIKENPFVNGITFSGGDCFEQADKFAYLGKKIRGMGLNIWCYTGYTFENILKIKDNRIGWNELLNNIDILVDGRFEQDKKEPGLKYRGSSNQRIIDVNESLKTGKVVTLNI